MVAGRIPNHVFLRRESLHGDSAWANLKYPRGLKTVGFRGSPRLAPAWSPDGRRIAIYNAAYPRELTLAQDHIPYADDVVLSIEGRDDRRDRWVVVRDRDGFVAEQAHFGSTAAIATRESCRAGVVVPRPRQDRGLVSDCEALVELREALFGQTAVNWKSHIPLRHWQGVVVDGPPDRATEIDFGQGALGASAHGRRLPPALAELEHLRRLDLSGNGVAGSIPAELSALGNLEALDLSRNELLGLLPPEVGILGRLRLLNLERNQLSGAIPPQVGNLELLHVLNLESNQLAGEILQALGQLLRLKELSLSDSQLTGAIPLELGRLADLEDPRLSGNDLTRCIPADLNSTDHDLSDLGLPRCETVT